MAAMSHLHQPQPNGHEEPPQTIPQKSKSIKAVTGIRSSTLSPPQVPSLLDKLEALLPYSIPLLRRIQFHLHQPVSESARIFVAVATAADAAREEGRGVEGETPTAGDGESGFVDRWLRGSFSSQGRGQDEKKSAEERGEREMPADSQPWIAAHIDLANPGQCQVWLFASWEADARYPFPSSTTPSSTASESASASTSQTPSPSPPSTTTTTSPPSRAIHSALMRSLFACIRADLVPQLPTAPPASWLELQRAGKYLSTPYSRNKVLFGTVSEKLWGHFPVEARTRTDDGYWKYLFRVEEEPPPPPPPPTPSATIMSSLASRDQPGDNTKGDDDDAERIISSPLPAQLPPIIPSASSPSVGTPPLPPDYHFGPMRPSHLQTVLDRTPIPRTLDTLRQYVSLGLFHGDSQPVGWGFLGKDASLSSLHTEPEHRGRGLAVALGRELLRRQHVVVSRSAAATAAEKGGEGRLEGAATESTTTTTTTTKTATSNIHRRYTWAHADVSRSNTASRRVMEKLGGRPLWMVMWTEMDIEKVMSTSSSPSSLSSR
ncbi:hypothetical protein CLAIMM_08351 [Cladophialophora immunda]|nr:hypothetical protein CLAIMM_08351 [Cladophialophora immunda]